MQLAMIGLGRMGANMAQRLLRANHDIVGFDLKPEAVEELKAEGAQGATALPDVVALLEKPRNLWIMVPAGAPVDATLETLLPLLEEGDVVVDGGNSNYKDSQRRAARLKEKGIGFVDAGVSGGIWGLENGYCLMVGGERQWVQRLEPLFWALSPGAGSAEVGPEVERAGAAEPVQRIPGYAHVGPSGAGHFAKMIHNGIEYGMMQAYAEGFELLSQKAEFEFDLGEIANLWMHGSVVRSWLLELVTRAFESEGNELATLDDWVPDSGEGRWTVAESIDLAVPAPVITLALQQRFRSRQDESFAAKLLSAMRNQFGGHAVRRRETTKLDA